MYAADTDILNLLSYLNDSEEIAFILPNGHMKWIAVNRVEKFDAGTYWLWHIPSGPLPLRQKNEVEGEIENLFEGWTEAYERTNANRPPLGNHVGVITINIRPTFVDDGTEFIRMSSFEWIGNHYRLIGFPAHPSTENFWKALKRWIRKSAKQVSRGGPAYNHKPEIWDLTMRRKASPVEQRELLIRSEGIASVSFRPTADIHLTPHIYGMSLNK